MTRMNFVFALLLLLFSNCKNDAGGGKTADNATPSGLSAKTLEGNWIARDYISKIAAMGSVVKQIGNEGAPFAFAFTFTPAKKDSVICYNNLKMWTLPYHSTNDSTLEVTTAENKKIYMQFDFKAKTMTLFDATSGNVKMSGYGQTREKIVNGYQAFSTALNHNLFGGGYILPGKNKTATQVTFMPTGSVRGLPGFDIFQVCPGGDCLVAGDREDAMFLSDRNNPQKSRWFVFRFSTQLDTLTIYNLKNERPTEKAGFTVQEPAFKLLRVTTK